MPIKVNNLSFTYNAGMPTETAALKDISFTAERGEILSIVGHTGSGKSTLVQHINGLILPQVGEVTVDGLRVSNNPLELRKIREIAGLVFQYPEQQIFAETVEEEISFGPVNWGHSGEDLKKMVDAAMAAMGLDTALLKCNPFALSGGQKRRVAIASVLASDPAYLVLDEPTAGLDANGVKELVFLLNERIKKGKGVIHVTHDLELALRISSKILVLADGSAVAFGTPAETAELLCEKYVEGLVLPDILAISAELREAKLIDGITWEPEQLLKMILEARGLVF
jgi:energy-coupling factor transport system ATP-binding protein